MTCANITLFSQHCYEQAWARLDGYYQIMSEQINLYWEPFPKTVLSYLARLNHLSTEHVI